MAYHVQITSEKGRTMKTRRILGRCIAATSLALAVIGLLSAPGSALAQQPKGAEKLMQLKPVKTVADLQALEAGDTITMSCPKCKDTWITVVEKTFKAVKPEELKKVKIHLCESCETRIVTKGHGKQARDVLVHTCKNCGSKDAFCCVQKKAAGPTPGMEEKK